MTARRAESPTRGTADGLGSDAMPTRRVTTAFPAEARRAPARGRSSCVALATFPAPASAVILYETGVGFRQPEFFVSTA